MPSYAEENVVLREKIAELEKEKKAIKDEIEKLRHEQNKLSYKTQKSVIEVRGLEDHRASQEVDPQLQKELEDLEARHRQEMEQLQKQFDDDCDELRKQNRESEDAMTELCQREKFLETELKKLDESKGKAKKRIDELHTQLKGLELKLNAKKRGSILGGVCKASCDHEKTLELLNSRVKEMEIVNTELMVENETAKQQVDILLSDWTVREAELSQAEEDFKQRLQNKWQERYRKWMETTEAKIVELQRANQVLRRMLNPD